MYLYFLFYNDSLSLITLYVTPLAPPLNSSYHPMLHSATAYELQGQRIHPIHYLNVSRRPQTVE